MPGNQRRQRVAVLVRSMALLVTGVAAFGSAACDDILEVELPTRVPAEVLDDPELSAVLVTSAIGDFECAFANYVIATGLLTDELYISTELIAPSLWDQRRIDPSNGNLSTAGCTSGGFGLFRPLQTARVMAELAYEKIDAFPDAEVPNKATLLARASAYAGYAYTLFGEGFCRSAFDQGPAMMPAEILGVAEERFTRAIELAQQANDAETQNMARVGRARVLLDLGRTAEAVTDARLVPEGFTLNATYSSVNERRENYVFTFNARLLQVSVDPRFRDLTVGGVADSRVPVSDAGRPGHDGFTPLWLQMKYTAEGSPIVLASWREAQLIIAEVEGGQTAVDIINDLRADHGLPSFNSSDPQQIRDQIIEERSRELYLEGHRFNDMLRFGLPFDTGVNHKGVTYGDTECLPLPQVEIDQNPNVSS